MDPRSQPLMLKTQQKQTNRPQRTTEEAGRVPKQQGHSDHVVQALAHFTDGNTESQKTGDRGPLELVLCIGWNQES